LGKDFEPDIGLPGMRERVSYHFPMLQPDCAER
jgi:hypothetical protein